MKPVDLVRKLRREAAFDPAALDRGKAELMAVIRQQVEPRRRPTIVPQVPYQDIGAALSFLERAFGFREIPTSRLVSAEGVIGHALVEFGDGVMVKGAGDQTTQRTFIVGDGVHGVVHAGAISAASIEGCSLSWGVATSGAGLCVEGGEVSLRFVRITVPPEHAGTDWRAALRQAALA